MSITKSDTNEQAIFIQSLPLELKNEVRRAGRLAAIPDKEFKKKIANNQKPSTESQVELSLRKSKSDDPFAWENYRTSDRRAIRLWGLLTDLVNDPMKIPMSEYLEMEISDVVRKDLEQLPHAIIKWLSNEQ